MAKNAGALVLSICGVCAASALGGVTLIGTATIAGDARDRSGLTGEVAPGVAADRLGSFGSAIAYSGAGHRFVALDDRGPQDGAVPWRTRCQTLEITIDPGSSSPVRAELVATVLLTDEHGAPLVGNADALNATTPAAAARFDPEGLRLSPRGTLWVSDEYGPWIDEFRADGRRVRRTTPPAKFLTARPAADPKLESPPASTRGRQANRGMEGLAISPDGATLWGIMQSPLIQDGALDAAGERAGRNVRILEVASLRGTTRELLYPLERATNGVNEAVAIRGGESPELLVLERDSKGGAATKSRALYRVGLAGATDISDIESLPAHGSPEGVRPVSKSVFLDFLDPRFGLAGPGMPEKIEGLAFGPDLPDGRHVLIVTTDNDLKADEPTRIWAFAIDPGDLPGYEPQRFEPGAQP